MWSVACGCLVYLLRGVGCVMCHVWCVVCGVWCVVCGVWCVVCGVWCVVCGVCVCVACGVWRVGCGVWWVCGVVRWMWRDVTLKVPEQEGRNGGERLEFGNSKVRTECCGEHPAVPCPSRMPSPGTCRCVLKCVDFAVFCQMRTCSNVRMYHHANGSVPLQTCPCTVLNSHPSTLLCTTPRNRRSALVPCVYKLLQDTLCFRTLRRSLT